MVDNIKRRIRTTQWPRSRASDSQLREPGFESCAAVLNPWTSFLLSCINEYMAVDSGNYLCTSSLSALIIARRCLSEQVCRGSKV